MKICRSLMLILALLVPDGFRDARAHEIQPAVIDVVIGLDEVVLDISFNSEVLLAGIDASQSTDTNSTPEAARYDRLRALDPAALGDEIRKSRAELLPVFELMNADMPLALRLQDVKVVPETDITLPRQTRLRLDAALPPGDAVVTFRAAPAFGPVVLRQMPAAGDDARAEEAMLYTVYLLAGDMSAVMSRLGQGELSVAARFAEYIRIGVVHIIPKGLDHIAFIIGLFFFSPRWRPLIGQVTIFTIAHSITLALASFGLVKVPAALVEPLIALSIAWIGVENIFRPRLGLLRLGVIFGFGLLHGLGFAYVLAETGFGGGTLALNLLAFNIGVELGQILVLVPLVLIALAVAGKPWYRARLAVPVSMLIAATGIWWFVERIIS